MRQPAVVTELDGTVSGDFFTVLCVGQSFTDDQWMNVYTFSMLRHWLLTYHAVSNGNSTADAGTSYESVVCVFFRFCFLFSVEPSCLFRHLQQTGCSSASPSPTPTRSRMVRRDLVGSLRARLLTPACSHRLTPLKMIKKKIFNNFLSLTISTGGGEHKSATVVVNVLQRFALFHCHKNNIYYSLIYIVQLIFLPLSLASTTKFNCCTLFRSMNLLRCTTPLLILSQPVPVCDSWGRQSFDSQTESRSVLWL